MINEKGKKNFGISWVNLRNNLIIFEISKWKVSLLCKIINVFCLRNGKVHGSGHKRCVLFLEM